MECLHVELVPKPAKFRYVTEVVKIPKKSKKPKLTTLAKIDRTIDFKRHELKPITKVVYKRLSAKIAREFPKVYRLNNDRLSIRKLKRRERRHKTDDCYKKIHQKKVDYIETFNKLFPVQKRHQDTRCLANVVTPLDFNKYDFRRINILKFGILAKDAIWSRTARKRLKAPRELKNRLVCFRRLLE